MARRLFFPILVFLFFAAFPVYALTSNDPLLGQQWYLDHIQVPSAWDKTTGSAEIVVAVLDTGVDLDHPDLLPNLWTNPDEIAGDGRDNDGNGFIDDVHGWDFADEDAWPAPAPRHKFKETAIVHGSIIAGVIGAAGNNGEGVVGINWQVRLMPVRILDAEGSGDSFVATRGIQYAVRNGAKVINLSFTGFELDTRFRDAIQEAYEAGVVVVAAVGNKDDGGMDLEATPIYPACLKGSDGSDWVIGVSASDKEDGKADFSNFGSACTDLAAPGVDMFGALYQDSLEPDFQDLYSGGWSGTSLASPVVAGAAALLKAYRPSLTPSQVLTVLQLSVDPLKIADPNLSGKLGAGRLNVARALETAEAFTVSSSVPPTPPTPSSLSLPSSAPSPVTGLPENVSSVSPGDYVRSHSFSTVYFVTPEGNRRPFLDVQTFRTHAAFNQVKAVTDATLPLLPLGSPMLPKPSTVLVKIQSDPQTYWVSDPGTDGRPVLRLIPSESEAIRLFGSSWADFVLDIPVTAWRWFAFGAEVGLGEALPTDQLVRREALR